MSTISAALVRVLAQSPTPDGPIEELGEQIGETGQSVARGLSDLSLLLIRIGAIVGGAVLLTLLGHLVVNRWERKRAGEGPAEERTEREQRAGTVAGVVKHATTAIIWTIAVLLVLGRVGVNLGPLIAGAGIAGVALGFGAQNLVRDHLAGFFILLEDQFSLGDVIEVAGVSGIVEKITLRTTILRDLDGRQHIVPNGLIEVSSNFTKEFSRYLMDLPVPYEADVDQAIQIYRDVLDEMRHDPRYAGMITTSMIVMGVNDYGDSQVDVRVYFDTVPGKQWETGREFRRRLLGAYEAAGISVPYPHRELILRGYSPEKGTPGADLSIGDGESREQSPEERRAP